MVRTDRHKCVICGLRPSPVGEYCKVCRGIVDKLKRAAKTEQPQQYLTYRGVVVGLYPNGTNDHELGTYRGIVLKREAGKLPKTRTVNLDKRCPGYTRHQIKVLKAKVLALGCQGNGKGHHKPNNGKS